MLTGQIADWLSALSTPLHKLLLYACSLGRDDLEYLSRSHHTGSLTQLGLEYNNLGGMGSVVCEIIYSAPRLEKTQLERVPATALWEGEHCAGIAGPQPSYHQLSGYVWEWGHAVHQWLWDCGGASLQHSLPAGPLHLPFQLQTLWSVLPRVSRRGL